MRTKKGFTIIELAISLIVIGIVSGLGITSIIVTLSDQRHGAEVENNLNRIRDGVVATISNDTNHSLTKARADFFRLLPKGKENQYELIMDDFGTESVCNRLAAGCTVTICKTEACAAGDNTTIIPNVLFSVIEKGYNKANDSQEGTTCNVKINKSKRDFDDRAVFMTYQNVRNLVGCEKQASAFQFITEKLPTVFNNDFTDNGIPIEIVPLKSGIQYEWILCLDQPKVTNFGTLRVFDTAGNQGTLKMQGVCTSDSAVTSINTTSPKIFIKNVPTTATLDIPTGVYRLRVLVRYRPSASGEYVSIFKDFAFTLSKRLENIPEMP